MAISVNMSLTRLEGFFSPQKGFLILTLGTPTYNGNGAPNDPETGSGPTQKMTSVLNLLPVIPADCCLI